MNSVQHHPASLCARLSRFAAFLLFTMMLCATESWAAGAPTTTELNISPETSVAAGTVLTFTATVTSSGTPVPAGLVKFCDMQTAAYCEDSAVLGSIWLTRSGTATLKLALSYGVHNIQAVFQGANYYAGSSSAAQSVSIQYGLLPSTTSLTSSQYSGYGGLNQAQVTVRGAPVPPLSGVLSFLDTSNANYLLTSLSIGIPTVGFSSLASVGGTSVQRPEYTVAGDFNNDGNLDFAVASNYANTIQIYLGNGDGTFVLKTSFSSYYPAGLAVADFNGDGRLDLTVLNYSTVSIYLGNGDGTFTSRSTPYNGSYPYGFTVADFNSDGLPDIAVTDNYANNIQILLGAGDGTFASGAKYSTGNGPQDVVSSDFNRDGRTDLAFVNEMSSTLTVLLGNGNGTFTAAPLVSLPAVPYTLVAGDFNADGIPDLAVSALIQGAEIYFGNGNGTFSLQSSITSGTKGAGYGMAVADFNNDGKTDLVVGNALFTGNGYGSFTLLSYVGGSGSPVSVGDFNSDGSPDLITPLYTSYYPYSGTVAIALEQSSFTATVSPIKVLAPGTHAVAASYSGDSAHAASQSSSVSMTGAQVVTTLSLSAAPATSVALGTTVQLAASLSPDLVGNYAPSGTVTFRDGTTVLGTGTVASGVAFFSTNSLPVGSHLITASYSGDTNFSSSTSNSITVTITGEKVTPSIIWPTPADITYGTPLSGVQLNATTDGIAGTFVYSPPAGTVLSAGPQTLSVTFTPADTNLYNPATASVVLTVLKAAPTVSTWPTASAITYGQSLASSTLTGGTASVPGAFAFTTPTLTPSGGTAAQSVTFTPTDTTNYNTVVGAVNVTVNTASQTITVTTPAPASAAYNTQFTVAATASSGLAVTYSSSGGCTNSGATFTITNSTTACTVKFDQAGNANYSAASLVIQTVTSSKATPTISAWPTASAINYGQSLASSTLTGGTASVAGAFAFTTPGTVPPVGTNAQNITFTPTDTTNYNTIASTVNVTVNPASQTITVTVPPPASAVYNTQFTVAATASSGLAVTYSSSGGCTNSGATFTMTSGTTACTVKFDQAGNASYAAAPTVTSTVTAVKATPTVSAWPTASAITYGQSLASSTLTGGTASVAGTFAFTTPATVPPAGAAARSVTFTPTASANYNTVAGTVNVTVNKATLTVTATSTSRTYGAANPTFTPTYTGFVNGDTAAVLSGAPALTTTATVTSAVGTYTITAAIGTLSSSNYSFVLVNGTLTITPAPLIITANNRTKTYGQNLTMGTTQFTATGLQNGQTVGAVTLTSTGSAAAATVSGSPYAIVPSNARNGTFNASNYSITYVNGSLVVNKATTTTTVTDNGRVRAGTAFTTNYTVAAQYNGTPTGTVTLTATNAGGTVVASCSSALTNGSGSCSMTIYTTGQYTLTGTYSGDSNFLTSSDTANHRTN